MTPRLTLDADGLARLRVRTHADTKSLRPRRFRLDSEGLSVAVELPGPDYLAALLDLDGLDVFRAGAGALLARPTGSEEEPEALTLRDLSSALWRALAALPECPDAGPAYRDLRLTAGTSSATFGAYLDDVVRAYRAARPALPKRPKAPQERGPAMTPTERKRAERNRRRREERESAAWLVATYLRDEDDAPDLDARVSGSALFEYAEEVLGSAVEDFEALVVSPDPEHDRDVFAMTREERLGLWEEERVLFEPIAAPLRPRRVSRRVLFETAEALGLRVTRPRGSVAIRTPATEEDLMALSATTQLIVNRAAEILADRAVEEVEAAIAEGRNVSGVARFFLGLDPQETR